MSIQRPPMPNPNTMSDIDFREAAMEYRRYEEKLVARVQQIAADLAEASEPLWHWGDGRGGWVMNNVIGAMRERGMSTIPDPPRSSKPKRKKISGNVRRSVYERDEYRCVTCGGFEHLSLDHIVPWSRGGSDDIGNLQTMCRACNSSKRDRV